MCGPISFPASISRFRLRSVYGLDAAGRAHRRHAVGEVQPRRAEGHLRDDDRLVEMARRIDVRPLQIEQMVVHPDDARQRRLAAPVDHPVTRRDRRAVRLHGGNPRAVQQQRLVLDRRRAGAVDDPQMRDRDLPRRHPHKLLDVGPERGRRRQHRRRGCGGRTRDSRNRGEQPECHTYPPAPARWLACACRDRNGSKADIPRLLMPGDLARLGVFDHAGVTVDVTAVLLTHPGVLFFLSAGLAPVRRRFFLHLVGHGLDRRDL